MTLNPIRPILLAIVSVLTAALLSATITPAFAEDVATDNSVVVEDPTTTVDESGEETTEDPTDESAEESHGTPVDILMTMRGPTNKVFKKLDKKSIASARQLAPKQHKKFFKTSTYAKWYAKFHIKERYGWSKKQFGYLTKLWGKESSWKFRSQGYRNYYLGIPQLNKAAILANGFTIKQFRNSPEVQIHLGSKYIKVRYGTPKHAWKHFLRRAWY